ncbi:unnamed protein product [marine sediment metagenome]|uniref:Uncharacterized protein n=1 Tax=marine sediment metagenome TaxID=412755 RepID=X0V7G0_9ZZZZ
MAKYNARYHWFMRKNAKFFMWLMERPDVLETIKKRLKEKKENETKKMVTRKNC